MLFCEKQEDRFQVGTGDAVSFSDASFSLQFQKLWYEMPGSRQERSKKRWSIPSYFSRAASSSQALYTGVLKPLRVTTDLWVLKGGSSCPWYTTGSNLPFQELYSREQLIVSQTITLREKPCYSVAACSQDSVQRPCCSRCSCILLPV